MYMEQWVNKVMENIKMELEPTAPSTKGHFSAKLLTKNPDGTEVWSDYDTRTDSEPALNQCILVFNSETGQYEKARDLGHAKELFAQHTNRILNPTPPPVNPEEAFNHPIRALNTVNKIPSPPKMIVL